MWDELILNTNDFGTKIITNKNMKNSKVRNLDIGLGIGQWLRVSVSTNLEILSDAYWEKQT